MAAYNPGDILVAELTIKGADFKRTFLTLDVYESLATPGIIVKIAILDPEDFIGNAKIGGGEEVSLAFKSPGSDFITYKLVINSINNVQSTQSMKAKTYNITCCSKEAHTARDKYVSKSYEKTPFHTMIKNIFEEFIGSKKTLNIEETKGMHNFIVPKLKPFQAIDAMRRRSTSSENTSGSFLFFENQDGYHFTTIEKIFKDKNIIKTLVQNAATGSDFLGVKGNAILSVDIPEQMSTSKSISQGYFNQSYRTFNMQTNEYKIKDNIKDPDKGTTKGGTGERLSSALKQLHSDLAAKISVMPVNNHKDIGLNQKSGIPEQSPVQIAYADSIASSKINLSTIGDSKLKAGGMVTVNLLKKIALSTMPTADVTLSGDFLIFNCRHKVNPPGTVGPRYTCELQLVKGAYEESFS